MAVIQNSATKPAFQIAVGGVDVTRYVPVDYGAVHIVETGPGTPGNLQLDLEDPKLALKGIPLLGADVKVWDLRPTPQGRILFGGNVTRWRQARHPSSQGTLTTIYADAYDAWLDRILVGKFDFGPGTNGTAALVNTDRKMVQKLINGWGAGNAAYRLYAPDATVSLTNASMDRVTATNSTLRQVLSQIADTATTVADTNRLFFVDHQMFLWYYKNLLGTTAPFAFMDGSYTATVVATGSLICFLQLREGAGTFFDQQGLANGTANGSITRGQPPLVVNEEQLNSIKLDGSSGFVSASANALHGGDGPWAYEISFQRNALGAAQALISCGANDVYIGIDATDHVVVEKEGVGTNFQSNLQIQEKTTAHHLVVHRPSGGPTVVILDGSVLAGTTTAQTFVAGTGAINLGRRLSATDRFWNGWIQAFSAYSANISNATAQAHEAQWAALAPENLFIDNDGTGYANEVSVAGKKGTAGSGWVTMAHAPGTAWAHDGAPPIDATISRPDSNSLVKRNNYAGAYLAEHRGVDHRVQLEVTGHDGWRVGQLVTITDAALGLNAEQDEIKQIDTDLTMGSGVLHYTLYLGALPDSFKRKLTRLQVQGAG